MAEGPDGVMWFGVSDGVCSYDGVNWKTFRPVADKPTPVLSVCVADDGTVYASDNETAWQMREGTWKQLFPVPKVPQWDVYKLTWTADGSLWVGTNYGLLRLRRAAPFVRSGKLSEYLAGGGIARGNARCVCA